MKGNDNTEKKNSIENAYHKYLSFVYAEEKNLFFYL